MNQIVCPHCGKLVGSESKFCRYCGGLLSAEQGSSSQLRPPTPDEDRPPQIDRAPHPSVVPSQQVYGSLTREIKHINVGSVFKVVLMLYLIIGLFAGIIYVISGTGRELDFFFTSAGGSIILIILVAIFYGVIAGISAAIAVSLYNLVANWVGGLRITIRR